MENGIFFEPWVIEREYEKGINGKKVMVLGHCHYSDAEKDKQNKQFTRDVVGDYIDWVQAGSRQ